MDYIWSIYLFTPCFLSESAFDFAVLSIELSDNIGSVLPWQQLPIKPNPNCIKPDMDLHRHMSCFHVIVIVLRREFVVRFVKLHDIVEILLMLTLKTN